MYYNIRHRFDKFNLTKWERSLNKRVHENIMDNK